MAELAEEKETFEVKIVASVGFNQVQITMLLVEGIKCTIVRG